MMMMMTMMSLMEIWFDNVECNE